MKKIIFYLMCLFPILGIGQTTLNPGEVVILEFNGNGTDGFTFMPLVDLAAGTTIHFTDYGWTGSAFNIAEDGNPSNGGNMITYTAPSTITAGTLIRQNSANVGSSAFTATAGWSYNFNNNNFITSLNTGGTVDNSNEGLFVFQGTPASPTFIWGYHTGQWGHGAYLQNFWSELPSPLVNGTNAVFFPNIASADVTVDDGYFNGPYTAASAADWLARVSNSANWITSSGTAPTLLFPNSYTVISTSVAPTVTTQAVSSIASTTATGNGNVTSLGSPNPTAHGVCWNTTGTPTTSDSKVDNGGKSATGAFTASMTSLSANTTYYVRAFATNTGGTSYGTEVSFTTLPLAPTVTTQATSSIGTTTATGNGNITSLGAPNPTAHGVCWNTTGTPSILDSKVDNGAKSSTGAFTASMTSLSANTTYYVRAYATNTAGTSYGSEVSFTTLPIAPTVTTQASSSIGTTTATGNGNVTSLGVPNPTAHGVCWNTTGTPTVSDSKVDNGVKSATGAFTASMTSLSANTTYYVRAYATNTAGTSYGTEVMFTTSPIAPTVTTQAVSSIASTTATGNGNVTSLGVPNPTAHGVCWNTTGTPTVSDSKVDNGAKSATGAFTASMTSLSANTTYYVRAYATNIGGTSYGTVVSFTTSGIAPTVTTQASSSIGTTFATGNGNVTSLGVPNPTAHGVCWNTTGTPTVSDSKVDNGAKSATGAFTASMTSLSANTTYYVRAYATNTAGTSYGTEVMFTTSPIAPTVTTQAVSSIASTTATGNGNVTSLGAPNPTAHGVCWNTTGTPTVSDSKVNNGAKSTTGAFTASMTSLSANTTYYVRAYATNTGGTSYGTEVMFTTSPLAPTVTTQAVSSIATTTATGNGNVTSLGVPNPTAHGVCWNTTGTPTVSDSKVDNGAKSATGAFTASMTSLNAYTTYYVRAYATNTAGTSYGTEVMFTTSPIAPTVTTQAVSSIATTTATGNGNVTSLGAPNPIDHGVCWNTSGNPTTFDGLASNGTKTATGSFTASMTSLLANTTYYVRAFAVNIGGISYGTEVSFTTLPINNAPTDISLSASSIGENVAPNSTIGTLSTTDPDVGNSFAYTLVAGTGSTDNASFNISGNSLRITNSPDFETKSSYTVRVRSTDQGSLFFEKAFTITINDLNEAPTDINLSASSINENVAVASPIGDFSSIDPDAGETFTYSLVAGSGDTDNGAFIIGGNTLAINTSLNYEIKNSYSIRVRTSDGVLTFDKVFTITINNVNETPSDIALTANSIGENVAANSTVGTLSTTDPDAGNTFAYTLVAGTGSTDNASFNISGSSLRITNSPDFETKSSYTVRVRSTDQGSLFYEKAFTITINDLNEAPTDIVLSASSINENVAANSTVGSLTSTDPDAGNTFTYTLVAGAGSTDNASFNISGSSLLITNSPDFETKNSYSIRVRTSDGVLTYDKVFTITINNVNETPSDIALTANSIGENVAANSTVGTLSTTDPDAGNTFAYTLVAGTGSTDNASFNISGSSLNITNSPDFETKSSYSVRVRTTDQGSLTYEEVFTITINDLNEAPTDITLSANSINENVVANSTVGTLTSTDPDAANTFAYTLVAGVGSTDNASFNISGSSLRMTGSPDFETKNSYSVRVRTTDQGSLTYEEVFTITINNENETPVVTAAQAYTIDENLANSTNVGTIVATDQDAGTIFSGWAITGGNTNNAFAIDASTGVVTVNNSAALDRELVSSYSLTVTVSDGVNTSAVQTVTINLADLNDVVPTITAAQAFTINENLANNSNVGTVVATDGDVTATIYSNWAITGGNTNNAFAIDASTGVITVNNSAELDRELVSSFNLTVTVSDGANTSAAQTVTINLTDLNDENPEINAAQVLHVTEQSPNGTTVGTVLATDEDVTPTTFQNWTITAGNSNGYFTINPSTGVITVVDNTGLNSAINPNFTLTLTVSDGVNTSLPQTVSIIVDAINDENPVITTSQSFSVDENSANNTVVGQVLATDPDNGTVFQGWNITAGNTGNAFAINSLTGEITVNTSSVLDYEGIPSFSLSIEVSDGLHNTNGDVTITLNNVNETPTDILLSASYIDENVIANSAVGTLGTMDPDAANTFTYTLVAGVGSTDNASFNISGNSLMIISSPDFETKSSYSVRVRTEDQGSLSYEKVFTITINNLNDNAPDLNGGNFSIDENSANGTSVGTITSTDADGSLNSLTYSITSGNTNNAFAINPTTGEITVNATGALDFETNPNFGIVIHVSDGTNSDDTLVTIDLNDVIEIGIDNNTLTNLKVYPNPASDQVSIDLSNKSMDKFNVEILDVNGSKVYQSDENSCSGILTIKLNGIATGVYLLRVYNEQSSNNYKLIIQK